jgi:hypothetical protein
MGPVENVLKRQENKHMPSGLLVRKKQLSGKEKERKYWSLHGQ